MRNSHSNLLPAAIVVQLCCALLLLACSQSPEEPGGDQPSDAQSGDSGRDSTTASDALPDGGCIPGNRVCASALTYLECGEDGRTRTQVQCDGGLACLDGQCVEPICEPFAVDGCATDVALNACNFSGTAWTVEDCPPFWTCESGVCIEPPCVPNETRCDGLDRILTCDPQSGEFVEQDQCESGFACYDDECRPLCDISEKVRSYVGCEYWTLDLDNLSDAETMEHTVVLSNPNDIAAFISIVGPPGQLDLDDAEVPPGGQLVIRFPIDYGLIRPGITDYSWRIESTLPVTAHQFNPLDNFTDPFTNDGTLLLPEHSFSDRYYAASWTHRDAQSEQLNGYVVVLAVDNGPTEVTITPTADASAGEGAPLTTDVPSTFELARGEVLSIQTADAGQDLTGSLITAQGGRIAVFGGHECGNVTLGVDRCDHMETQLLPVELLRNEYIATKFATRVEEGRSEPDYWRVIAVDGATLISTEPEIAEIDGAILGSGEWLQIEYRDDFILRADRPVMMAHYMAGSNSTGIPRNCFDDTGPPTGIGDPAMTQLVPIDQFRDDYIVLTPFAYVEDYLNLAVPASAIDSVELDGEPVSEDVFEQIADSNWYGARIAVEDGTHRVTADEPFGL
ncbi:MAG: IgGFc-binding protein, partial [Myxococcales bacterium]|nr:IgGFc-binding protein [Myxococcales bacterium]